MMETTLRHFTWQLCNTHIIWANIHAWTSQQQKVDTLFHEHMRVSVHMPQYFQYFQSVVKGYHCTIFALFNTYIDREFVH